MKAIILCFLFLLGFLKANYTADMRELIKKPGCFFESDTSVIFRAYKSNGQIDPYAKESLIRSRELECTIYISPCFKCNNPRKQIADTCNAIYGTDFVYYPYLVIEDPELWSGDTSSNKKFIELMVAEVLSQKRCFIDARFRTTKNDWEKIVGNDWTIFSGKDLWYVSNDKKLDFDDFVPFGGWKIPFLKQYDQDEMYCENNLNWNFQPKAKMKQKIAH